MPASIGSKMPASMAQAYQLRCEPKHEGATGLAHCPLWGCSDHPTSILSFRPSPYESADRLRGVPCKFFPLLAQSRPRRTRLHHFFVFSRPLGAKFLYLEVKENCESVFGSGCLSES